MFCGSLPRSENISSLRKRDQCSPKTNMNCQIGPTCIALLKNLKAKGDVGPKGPRKYVNSHSNMLLDKLVMAGIIVLVLSD